MNGNALKVRARKRTLIMYAGMSFVMMGMTAMMRISCAHQQSALRQGSSDIQNLVFKEMSDLARADEDSGRMLQDEKGHDP